MSASQSPGRATFGPVPQLIGLCLTFALWGVVSWFALFEGALQKTIDWDSSLSQLNAEGFSVVKYFTAYSSNWVPWGLTLFILGTCFLGGIFTVGVWGIRPLNPNAYTILTCVALMPVMLNLFIALLSLDRMGRVDFWDGMDTTSLFTSVSLSWSAIFLLMMYFGLVVWLGFFLACRAHSWWRRP